jgi:hypothetical protein
MNTCRFVLSNVEQGGGKLSKITRCDKPCDGEHRYCPHHLAFRRHQVRTMLKDDLDKVVDTVANERILLF